MEEINKSILGELEYCCMDYQRTGDSHYNGRVAAMIRTCGFMGIDKSTVNSILIKYPRVPYTAR